MRIDHADDKVSGLLSVGRNPGREHQDNECGSMQVARNVSTDSVGFSVCSAYLGVGQMGRSYNPTPLMSIFNRGSERILSNRRIDI